MRYLGSKGSVVEQVLDLIGARVQSGTLCDPFGGIGTVGAAAKQRGYEVIAGDQLAFAHAFQVARIEASRKPAFQGLKTLGLRGASDVEQHLAALPPRDGWLVREYAQERRFFQRTNAERLEAVRREIASWNASEALSVQETKVLLASLINSADRVANTAGTYYAYLKSWHRKALKPVEFRLLPPTRGSSRCSAQIADAQNLAESRPWDVLYLDPPFNGRNYGRYYHLPETLALGATYSVAGQSGMPARDIPASSFYSVTSAARALRNLIRGAEFKLLVLHYAPDGIIPADTIARELSQRGRVQRYVLDAKGYTTSRTPRRIPHDLYLVHA